MGLFIKKQNTGVEMPLYNIGLSKTVLIVGLGNPGKEYQGTRHSVGFTCLDNFAAEHGFPAWSLKKSLKGEVTHLTMGDTRVILLKPTTFMNNSGEAVKAVQQFYKIDNTATLVVHDELDLPFGTIRSKQGGGSAGHNGLKSLIAQCGEDFARIRIGVANDFSQQADSADFVLSRFTKAEQAKLKEIRSEADSLLTRFITTSTL